MKNPSPLKALLSLGLVMLIDSIGLGIIFPLLNPLLMEAGGLLPPGTAQVVRETLYGVGLAVFTIGMFFASPIIGDISDRIGRKKILVLSLAGTAAAYLLSALAISIASVALFLASRLIAGICAGSQTLSQAAAIDISPEGKKTTFLSALFFFNSIGFVLGPLVGGFLSDHSLVSWFSLSTPLYFAALLSFINIFLLQQYYVEANFQKAERKKLFWHKAISLAVTAFTDRAMRMLSLIFVLAISGWAFYYQYVGVLLEQNYHYTSHQVGVFLSGVAVFFGSTLLLLVPRLVKYFKNRTLAFAGVVLVLSGLIITFAVHSVAMLWVGSLLISVGEGLFYVNCVSLISDAVGADRQGQAMGILASLGAVCWTVTSAVSGPLLGMSVSAPFITGAVSVFCAMLIFLGYILKAIGFLARRNGASRGSVSKYLTDDEREFQQSQKFKREEYRRGRRE